MDFFSRRGEKGLTSHLSHLPAFAGEFLLTGGIYSFGKRFAAKTITKGLQKVTQKQLGKFILKNTAETMVGSAFRTAALPQMIVDNYFQRRLKKSSGQDKQGNLIALMKENKESKLKTVYAIVKNIEGKKAIISVVYK